MSTPDHITTDFTLSLYSYTNTRGNKVQDNDNYYSFINKLLDYENNKLYFLKKYPPFISDIENIRRRHGIKSSLKNTTAYENNEICDIYIDLINYREQYGYFCTLDDPFLNAVDSFSKKNTLFRNINKHQGEYIALCYYILYDRPISENYLAKVLNEKDQSLSVSYAEEAASTNAIIMQEDIDFKCIREKLGIPYPLDFNDIGMIYTAFNKYLYYFSHYSKLNDTFLTELKTLYDKYPFLNIYNVFDFQALITYIYFYEDLQFVLQNSEVDYKNDSGNSVVYTTTITNSNYSICDYPGLPKIFSGHELLYSDKINLHSLYVEIPIYARDDDFKLLVPYILSKAVHHYNIPESFRELERFRYYYRDKYIFEKYQELRQRKEATSHNKKSTDKIYSELFDDLVSKSFEVPSSCKRPEYNKDTTEIDRKYQESVLLRHRSKFVKERITKYNLVQTEIDLGHRPR